MGGRCATPTAASPWRRRRRGSPSDTASAREAVDCFAARSQARAKAAWDAGAFADEVVPVHAARIGRPGRTVAWAADEHMRPDTTPEGLAKLPPYFRKDGVVTAGNASGICDGAAALVVAGGRPRRRPRAPPDRPAGGMGRGRRGPDHHGHRAGAGLAARARARGARPRAHGPGRDQRGLRGPVPGGRARAGPRPRAHQRRRRRRRHRPSARGERRADHRCTCCTRCAGAGGRYGLGAACIGGGQGAAVIVEAFPA